MKLPSPPHSYSDIDWEELHKNACLQKAWKSKNAEDWDKKAPVFSKSIEKSEYIDIIISELPLKENFTLLDIGSGPGTLAIPIARQIANVTAIDFSQGMLDELDNNARMQQVQNISTRCLSWEDDWDAAGLIRHDITLASRSLGINNLKSALTKLNRFASQYVFLTDRINPTPFDQEAFRLLGRPFHPGPDYIYTVNMLYSMNIHPCIKVLEFDKYKRYDNFDAAMQAYRWMLHDTNKIEDEILRKYLIEHTVSQNNQEIIIQPKIPHRWALIWWKKQ